MNTVFGTSRSQFVRAQAVVAGGVNSNIRGREQPWPLFFDRGEGSHLRDVDGNDLIDYVLANGPMILGHSPERVIEAVVKQLSRGILFAGQSSLEIEAAELVCETVPAAERVRFNATGTEAVQAALRIARAATGRQKVLIFQGHYDGWADNVLWNFGTPAGMSADPDLLLPVPESMGVEAAVASNLLVMEWNDAPALERVMSRYGSEIAAVLMEPSMSDFGVILPEPNYLDVARELTRKHGSVLIFDEVVTGFRVALGGAQEVYGVIPDLVVLGKAIASGFPVSCVAGDAALFDGVADGSVVHAGTFNGSPIGMAALVETLSILIEERASIYGRMGELGQRLIDGVNAAAEQEGVQLVAQGYPALFSLAFSERRSIRSYREALESDRDRLRAFSPHLLVNGVRIAGSGKVLLSSAHTFDDIDRSLLAVRSALHEFGQDRVEPSKAVG